jgi:hypothetical protein
MQIPNCSNHLLVFVDASENLVIADDVVTPLNPLIAPIEEEEFEKNIA